MTSVPLPPQRLQKVLAGLGLGSRRTIEEWIRAGRVQVNGEPADLGLRVGPADRITVDGRAVAQPAMESASSSLGAVAVLGYHKPLGEVTTRLSATAAEIARRFAAHPAVARVRTADTGPTAAAFRALRRPGAGAGALITIELRGEMRGVYDRLRVVKGPSFGLRYTLATPFLWLAHFEQVTTEAGRAEIRAAGLDPDLLRISVGAEPMEEIWEAFAEALA